MSESGVRHLRPTIPALHFAAFLLFMVCLVAASMALSPAQATAAGNQVIHEGEFHSRDLRWEVDPLGAAYPVLDGTRPLAEPGLPQLPVREIGGRWYNRLGTVLVDQDFDEKTTLTAVRFASPAYFEFVRARPDLHKVLAASRTVVVMTGDGQAVLVSDRVGIEDFSEEERQQIGLTER